MIIIETERIILRLWKEEDAIKLFHIYQDPKVTQFTGKPFTLTQINKFIVKSNKRQIQYGYTVWAVELKKTKELMGFISLFNTKHLKKVNLGKNFIPDIGIGWCLGSEYWGKGYATEGARAVIEYGFNQCGLIEIASFTVPMNKASIRVMEKIGMQRDLNGDFAHPELPPEHKNSLHILYRIKK